MPIFLTFYTYKFPIHTHTGLAFESPRPDLKFVFRASHAFYMHGASWRGGGGGMEGVFTPNELYSAVGILGDIAAHTLIPAFPVSATWPSFSCAHSALSTLVFTASWSSEQREGLSLWRQVWSEQRQEGVQKPALGAYIWVRGFNTLVFSSWGGEGWQMQQCLGTALMSAAAQSFTRRLSPWHDQAHTGLW